ncbi:hypothetical protein [Gemmatimonas groenlandica]|uniref:DUF4350 domain-containing protein n=1 Tax=Gemmatimonas groenlandica TaxID=2732249 RepID=A0A6M4IPI8_9BACT|nr:hypothetical protein [Gemmatimonas groenlandica]QJR35868.1 hypothetical protein HKW67_10270 [Gemmatimonas groenlandica]
MTPNAPNPARALLERVLRTVALLTLAVALYLANRPASPPGGRDALRQWSVADVTDSTATALTTAVVGELIAAAGDTQPRRVTVDLSALPSPRARALFGAVDGADIALRWIDRTQASGIALSATTVAGHSQAIDVRVAGSTAASLPLVLRDLGGMLDSIPATRRAGWRLASMSPPLRVLIGASEARVFAREAAPTRRVMLMAEPGWESKFVAAALEEAGWQVDGSYRVSPRTAITVGAPARLDTSRYAVVVLLDSMSVDAAGVTRFVQQGGGLVLGGDALRISALSPISPARATSTRGGAAGALLTNVPQRGLEAWELVANRGAAVVRSDPSEHGHAEPVLVAQRVGAGRVVASAYRNSWRWRMEGTDDGAAEHRAWWGAVLGLAAGVPTVAVDTLADAYPGDAAPFADLVARIGGPVGADSAVAPNRTSARSAFDALMDRLRAAPGLLFMVIALTLLGEWASRRLRGNR